MPFSWRPLSGEISMFDRLVASRRPFTPAALQPSGAGAAAGGGAPGGGDPPVLPAGPPLAYPEALRRTGTAGSVVVQVIIDSLGRAEPGSLVLQSSHAGFEAAARAYVLGAVFRPGRTHGRAV